MDNCVYNNSGNGTIEINKNLFLKLLSLCKGLVASGVLREMEADLIKSWLAAERTVPDGGPVARADMLMSRIISEGELSDEERKELFEIMDKL